METVDEYRVVARNTATASANKIHDDAVARRYGFAGGLVPGVDVYAYMTHPPAAGWGRDWLARGSMRARFLAPVYEGEEVVVVAGEVGPSPAGHRIGLELRGPDGAVRASGEAQLPQDTVPPRPGGDWAAVDQSDDPPEASPASLAAGTALALAAHGFRADNAAEYLAEISEGLPLYADRGVAHPGWLLRDANRVLSANVRLGPWIHVESVVQHHGLVHAGDAVHALATVTREWERKGHRFVELDVGLFAGGDRPVAQVVHTAIYRPRPKGG
jgi:acyl dehydratase